MTSITYRGASSLSPRIPPKAISLVACLECSFLRSENSKNVIQHGFAHNGLQGIGLDVLLGGYEDTYRTTI